MKGEEKAMGSVAGGACEKETNIWASTERESITADQ